jgi:hypothetical protein
VDLFGNDRVIAENVAYEQQKLVKYSHVVANLVMLHTLADERETRRWMSSRA